MVSTEASVSFGRRVQQFRTSLSPSDWRRTKGMFSVILLLHVLGFGIFIAFVVPDHYKGLGIGISLTAYTLGLRHAFDADHISAIDNTTRKLMNERREVAGAKRPLSVGYYFSLGHSTIVIAIGAGLIIAEKAVYGAVSNNGSGLEQFGGIFGTIVSASFLYLIAAPQHRHPGRHRQGVPLHATRAPTTRPSSKPNSTTVASCTASSASG